MRAFNLINPDWLLFGRRFEKAEAPEIILPKKDSLWDITGNIDTFLAKKHCQRLAWQYELIQKNPAKVRRRLRKFNLLFIPAIPLAFIPMIGPFILIGTLIISVVAWGAVRGIKVDIAKYAIAKERGWLYDPGVNYEKGKLLSKEVSELFANGNKKYAEDQLWGAVKTKKSLIPFYAGEYSYSQGSGKNEHTYYQHFFSFKLAKPLPVQFKLSPEHGSFFGLGKGKEIDVESIAFNKKFAFYYKGSKEEQSPKILKILTPSVQVHLMELTKKKKGVAVLFKNNAVTFRFANKLLRMPKSKILRDGKVSQKDIDVFNKYINSCTQIAEELSNRLS